VLSKSRLRRPREQRPGGGGGPRCVQSFFKPARCDLDLTAPARDIDATFTLDSTLLAQRRSSSARRIHTIQIPAIRTIGFVVLCLIAILQDLRSGVGLDDAHLNWLIATNLAYAGVSWLDEGAS
jgi:hypothetical protein